MPEPSRQNARWDFGEVLKLSIPASMSGLNRVVTQFVDGWMVAGLGAATVTGQAMGGLVAFMPESFVRGILGVVNTYVSQNLGAGRFKRCGQYTWAAMLIVLVSVAVFVPLAFFAPELFALIGHESDVQPFEVLYFRYMVLSAPIALAIRVLEGFFYGVHRPGIVYGVSLLASGANVFGNWVLIFGNLGFPALGLQGAAISSVLSWVLQLVILAWTYLSWKFHQRYGTRLVRAVRLKQCGQILRIGLPAGGSVFLDIATWTIFMTVLIGRFGKLHMTAASNAMRYMRISFIPAIGIGIAATVMVGKSIGRGGYEAARRHTHAALLVAMAYMALCGLAFVLFRKPMIGVFVANHESAYSPREAAEIVRIGANMLVFMALFQVADAINIVLSGALRGAGDTRWPMLATGFTSVVILVGGGSLLAWAWPGLQSMGPFAAAVATYIALAAALAWRFRSGAWRSINLLHRAGEVTPMAPSPAPVAPPTMITIQTPQQESDGGQ